MKFRIARHTDNFLPIITFYTEILGLELLGSFENHNNYDGIFIGKRGADWHLEFTKSAENATHSFDEDDLLVFYIDTKSEYQAILNRFAENKVEIQQAKNPYWNENGTLVLDPDGYGIVISF